MLLFGSMRMSAQFAALGINGIINVPTISVGQTVTLTVDVRNFGFDDITAGCALVTISVPVAIVSITGVNGGLTDPIWTIFSSSLPAGLTMRNTGGMIPADGFPYFIVLNIIGTNPSPPLTINGAANLNPFQGGCLALGDLDPTDNNQTSSIGVIPALSVKLSSFTGTATGCKTVLEWTSQQEENSKEYQVQVSHDGRAYATIGTVAAAGNSSISKSYQFTDKAPSDGYNFYQLKIVDIDGKVSYSSTAIVRSGCSNKTISIHPNPVTVNNKLTVIIKGYSNNLKGELIDISGKILRTYSLKNGSNTVLVESMAQGNYVLRVTDASNGVAESFKVVVIK
jgi:uncharacterized repeat protein (TIGR01451 family)